MLLMIILIAKKISAKFGGNLGKIWHLGSRGTSFQTQFGNFLQQLRPASSVQTLVIDTSGVKSHGSHAYVVDFLLTPLIESQFLA